MAKEKEVDATKVAESLVSDDSKVSVVYTSKFFMNFPPSVTEQIHHASIAEQIRAGQGSSLDSELSKDYYDFPDGKDDGSRGVGVFELSEPAEVFERETKFNKAISAQYQASIASKKAEETSNTTESQKSSQNQSSGVSQGTNESGGTDSPQS